MERRKSITIDHDKILNSEEGLLMWLELLHYKGIAIIKNAPIEKEYGYKFFSKELSHN